MLWQQAGCTHSRQQHTRPRCTHNKHEHTSIHQLMATAGPHNKRANQAMTSNRCCHVSMMRLKEMQVCFAAGWPVLQAPCLTEVLYVCTSKRQTGSCKRVMQTASPKGTIQMQSSCVQQTRALLMHTPDPQRHTAVHTFERDASTQGAGAMPFGTAARSEFPQLSQVHRSWCTLTVPHSLPQTALTVLHSLQSRPAASSHPLSSSFGLKLPCKPAARW